MKVKPVGGILLALILLTLPSLASAQATKHPANVLHVRNVSKDALDFEIKEDGASWETSATVIKSRFPMGNGVSVMLPLKKNQTPQTQYLVKWKLPDKDWTKPVKMGEIDGSLDIPR